MGGQGRWPGGVRQVSDTRLFGFLVSARQVTAERDRERIDGFPLISSSLALPPSPFLTGPLVIRSLPGGSTTFCKTTTVQTHRPFRLFRQWPNKNVSRLLPPFGYLISSSSSPHPFQPEGPYGIPPSLPLTPALPPFQLFRLSKLAEPFGWVRNRSRLLPRHFAAIYQGHWVITCHSPRWGPCSTIPHLHSLGQ